MLRACLPYSNVPDVLKKGTHSRNTYVFQEFLLHDSTKSAILKANIWNMQYKLRCRQDGS